MQGLFLDLYFSCSFHLCLIKVNKTRRIICLLSGVPHLNTTVWGLRGVPQKSHTSQYGSLIWRILLPPGRSPWLCSQKPCSRYSTSTDFNKMVTSDSRSAGLFFLSWHEMKTAYEATTVAIWLTLLQPQRQIFNMNEEASDVTENSSEQREVQVIVLE